MSPDVDIGELQVTYDALVDAALEKDAEQYAELFVEDSVLMVPHSRPVRGPVALVHWLEAFFAEWSMEVDSMAFEGVTIGDRVAFTWWNAAGRYISADGEETPFDQKYLDTLVRGPDGSWRFAAHMASSNVEGEGVWATWRPGGGA